MIPTDASAPFLIFASLALKATVLLLLAFVLGWVLRRSSAATRHVLWAFAAGTLLLLPLLEFLLPQLRLAVLPGAAPLQVATDSPTGIERDAGYLPYVGEADYSSSMFGHESGGTEQILPEARSEAQLRESASAIAARPMPERVVPAFQADAEGDFFPELPFWQVGILVSWLTGTLFLLALVFGAQLRVACFVRRTSPVPPQNSLARQLADAAGFLGVFREIDLRLTASNAVPFTCGLFRSAIVLPEEAERWPEAKLRAVFLHELAHVKRRDCMTQLMAQVCAAFYWFHPLAWFLNRQMRIEREKACDDLVLSHGIHPSFYGETLLTVAASHAMAPAAPANALAMARKSSLENRLLAILDGGRNRRGPTRAALTGGFALCGIIALPVAMLELAARESSPGDPPDAIEERSVEIDTPLRVSPTREYPMGEFPQSVALADLTGNGHLDVMTANRESHTVTVRLGAGDGSFGEATAYVTDPEPLFVRASDLDGDGIPELITANFSNTVSVFPGKGDGTFGEPVHYPAGEGKLMPLNVVVGDFDEDGLLDLATANFLDHSVSLLPGIRPGVFGNSVRIPVGNGPISIVTADFNRDGHADLAVANRRGKTATILLGNGRGEFSASDYPIGAGAGFIAAGDLTNDGAIDLAVANFDDSSVSLLLGDGGGKFAVREIAAGGLHPSSLGLADMNGNGWLDIVVVAQMLRSVAVLRGGEPEILFKPAELFPVGAAPDSVALGDLNGDGLPDIVTGNLRGNSITVLLSGEAHGGMGPVVETEGVAPETLLRGRVEDSRGKAVSGAVVQLHGISRGTGSSWGGFDKAAITDDDGLFTLREEEPFETADVRVDAPSFAQATFFGLISGDAVHELVLNKGVSVSGRVVENGEPVAGVSVGLMGVDRSIVYVGDFSATTDADGGFLFENIPAETEYHFYGHMRSLQGRGAIPVRKVKTKETGTRLELGDCAVEPGFTIEGRVRMADGGSPRGRSIFLGREDAADSLEVVTDADGFFRFTDVPAEQVSVNLREAGHRFSLGNANIDPLNPYQIIGRVVGDKTDLILEIEPGEWRQEYLAGNQMLMAEEPLRGAETPPESGDIRIAGTVVDADTGEPLPVFTVTEGRKSPYGLGQVEWFQTRRTEHTDGAFTTYFADTGREPAVLIEADGYLPFASQAITETEARFEIELRRGDGPSGTLLLPTGIPAAGVTVYLADERNRINVNHTPGEEPRVHFTGVRTETDGEGRFSFRPQPDATGLVVITAAGIARTSLEELAREPVVRIQPWARVEGVLLSGTEPQANERVGLSLVTGSPMIDLSQLLYEGDIGWGLLSYFVSGVTDGEGRFVFEKVPPGPVSVSHWAPSSQRFGPIRYSRTTNLIAEAGETRSVVLGGAGRPVIGRIVVEDPGGKIDWRTHSQQLVRRVLPSKELHAARERALRSEEAVRAASREEERAAASREYARHREEWIRLGREFVAAQESIAIEFDENGAFRVTDVPEGSYHLKLTFGIDDRRIQVQGYALEIPAAPAGRPHEPYDLGVIQIERRNGGFILPGATGIQESRPR